MRAISGDEASTNLAVNIHISGEEKAEEGNEDGSMAGVLIGVLSLLVLLLLITLAFAGIQLRDRGFFEDEEFYDEIEEVVESMTGEWDTTQPPG